jgi:hypothetical protein
MSDPNARIPSIVPLNFWIEYEPQPDGSMKEVEKVEWSRRGTNNTTTVEKISRLSKKGLNGELIPEWEALKPYYDRWKAGQEAPINGTPLAAWPGATPQLVKALEPYHMHSIEDLADLTDNTMARVPIPGIRGFREKAKAYIAAVSTTAPIAGELAALRDGKRLAQEPPRRTGTGVKGSGRHREIARRRQGHRCDG